MRIALNVCRDTARSRQRRPLTADDFVISADEKTSVQARHRCHATQPPRAGMVMKVEHEYTRAGAWAYLAALDVHHARLFGRCESTTGIAPVDRLVEHVMTSSPYRDARRVFWIVDNGSSHRGARAVERLQQRYPNLVLVHGPVHASWLHQIEIYCSIVQRKVLTPNDFECLADVESRLLAFQRHYQSLARPFEWTFTRHFFQQLLDRAILLKSQAAQLLGDRRIEITADMFAAIA